MTAGDDEDWELSDLDIALACPACGREMVHDPDSLPLAYDRDWALLECGACRRISSCPFWQASGWSRERSTSWPAGAPS